MVSEMITGNMIRQPVILGIGTNVGDRLENCTRAIRLLQQIASVDKVSGIYETVPEGYVDQNRFYNLAVRLFTASDHPDRFLAALLGIERRMGRVRTFQNGPRVIDLDIIFWGDHIIEQPGLTVPHPRAHHRIFVLQPLVDIIPEYIHPILKHRVQDLYDALFAGMADTLRPRAIQTEV